MSEYDIVVVGAGPAGSTAGIVLADNGYDVLIIDKADFPRNKVCGGLITYKTIKLLEKVYSLNIETLRDEGVIKSSSKSYDIYHREEKMGRLDMEMPFYFVDRKKYDSYFVRKAEEKGCNFHGGEKLIKTVNGHVLTSEVEYKPDFIVGADGVNSTVRKTFVEKGLVNPERWKKYLGFGMESEIDRTSLDIELPRLYMGLIDWGYGWVFPFNGSVSCGVGGLIEKNHDVGNGLDKLSSILSIRPGEKSGCPFPYGNYIEEPAHQNILLTGDAAGYVDPFMGEGIYYAHLSGMLSAESILEGKGNKRIVCSKYKNKANIKIIPELKYARLFRKIMWGSPEAVQYFIFKYLINVFGNMMVDLAHGKRSYRLMLKK